MRTFTHNVIVIAEHQQATKRGMEPTVVTAHRCRTNSAQKTLVIEARPRATRTDRTKTDTIRPHRISIEISNSEIAQYLGIHRFGPLIPEHCRNLLSRATIVAFTASAISSCEEIVVDIHGALLTRSSRNMNGHHYAIIRFKHFDFRFDRQHGTHFGAVAYRIPKILTKMFALGCGEPRLSRMYHLRAL